MTRAIALTIFTLWVISGAWAQVSFTAVTSAEEVLVNVPFEVKFILENARGDDFTEPDFEGFEVLSGPNRSVSTTFINGKSSRRSSLSFTLLPVKPGTFKIGKASVKVGSSTLFTEELSIKVVAGEKDGGPMSDDEQLFIRAEIDTTTIYTGQQVRIDYNLYSAVNAHNYNIIREDSYDDFYYRYVQDFGRRTRTRVINGVQYRVNTLKSIALFGRKPGTFTLEPFVARVSVASRDSRSSFFLTTRSVPKTVATDSVTIKVLPLPEPAPVDFTGAVGKYRIDVDVKNGVITTDDALEITLDVVGTGDSRKWTAPALDEYSDDFEIYDPKIIDNKSSDERGVVLNRRTIDYLMIPKKPGQYLLDIPFVYFDPDSARYVELRSSEINVLVKEGSLDASGEPIISAEDAGMELRDLMSPGKLPSPVMGFLYSPLFFALSGMPFIWLFVVLWQRKKKSDYELLDPAERKRREARKRAMKHLEGAKDLMGRDDSEYYAAISQGIFTYLSGKLGIMASELTKSNVDNRMAGAGISDELRQRVLELFALCERVLYAGASGVDHQQDTYNKALTLVTDLEAELS